MQRRAVEGPHPPAADDDLMATRRYALMKLRQIQTDRRAMLQRQLERYRQERGLDPND